MQHENNPFSTHSHIPRKCSLPHYLSVLSRCFSFLHAKWCHVSASWLDVRPMKTQTYTIPPPFESPWRYCCKNIFSHTWMRTTDTQLQCLESSPHSVPEIPVLWCPEIQAGCLSLRLHLKKSKLRGKDPINSPLLRKIWALSNFLTKIWKF